MAASQTPGVLLSWDLGHANEAGRIRGQYLDLVAYLTSVAVKVSRCSRRNSLGYFKGGLDEGLQNG